MPLPTGKKRLLKVFFLDPWAELHQRELARRAKVPSPNAHKFLNAFARDGLLLRRDVSRMSFFRPNWQSDELLKVFEHFEVTRRQEFYTRNERLARRLANATEILVRESEWRIQLVMLVGSVAKGTWTQGDELDLVVLAPSPGAPVSRSLSRAKTAAGAAVILAPVLITIDHALTAFRQRRAFHQETWGDRAVLYNEFLFWQIVRWALAPHT